MKNPEIIMEPDTTATPFVERRAAVRDPGRSLATREPHRPVAEPLHYPVAPYTAPRIPVHPDLVALAQPFSDRAEEFRSLRTELLRTLFALQPRRALAILSQEAGDGKSYVAANLAVSFSQLGSKTLLIDGNLRDPSLHGLLGMPMRAGLREVLAGRVYEGEAIVPVPGVPDLHLLPAGHCAGDPVTLLQGTRMRALLMDLVARFDQVLLDTPANASGPDGRVLAVQGGGALIVGCSGRSRVAPLQTLLDQLSRSPTMLAGVVLNRR